MEKSLKISLFLCFILLCYFSAAFAATNASSTITSTVPVLNTIQTTGGSLNISVNSGSGQLSGNISTGFTVFTNNSKGVNVDFNVTTSTSAGDINASISTAGGSNTGIVALGNNTVLPTAASVANALSGNPSIANNANAVAYNIQFTGNKTNINPVYSGSSSTDATVLAPVGTTVFTAQIINNNTLLTNTYDNNTDNAGSYTATVNCTISSP